MPRNEIAAEPEERAKADPPGRHALEQIERVLAARPAKDDHGLSEVSRYLSAFRREYMVATRDRQALPQTGERLSRLNAIISVVMAMHFPLGKPPWEEFAKVEGWLADLVAEIEGDAT